MEEKSGKGFIKNALKVVLTLAVAAGISIGSVFVHETYFDDKDEQVIELEEKVEDLQNQLQQKDEEKSSLQAIIDEKTIENQRILEILTQEQSSNGITLEQSNLQLQLVKLSDRIAQQTSFSKEDRVATDAEFAEILARVDILVEANQIAFYNHQTVLKAVANLKQIYAMKNMIGALTNTFTADAVEYSQFTNSIGENGIVITSKYYGIDDKNIYYYEDSGNKTIVENGKAFSLVSGNYQESDVEIGQSTASRNKFIDNIENEILGVDGDFTATYVEKKDGYVLEFRGSDGIKVIECRIENENMIFFKNSLTSAQNSYAYVYDFKQMTQQEFDEKYEEIWSEISDAISSENE